MITFDALDIPPMRALGTGTDGVSPRERTTIPDIGEMTDTELDGYSEQLETVWNGKQSPDEQRIVALQWSIKVLEEKVRRCDAKLRELSGDRHALERSIRAAHEKILRLHATSGDTEVVNISMDSPQAIILGMVNRGPYMVAPRAPREGEERWWHRRKIQRGDDLWYWCPERGWRQLAVANGEALGTRRLPDPIAITWNARHLALQGTDVSYANPSAEEVEQFAAEVSGVAAIPDAELQKYNEQLFAMANKATSHEVSIPLYERALAVAEEQVRRATARLAALTGKKNE